MSGDDGWGALVAPGRRGPVLVLAAGVLLYAVDSYVTSSVLPTAVAEIGGESFYSWVATVYLLAAVVTASAVSRVLAVWSARRAYLVALAAFGAGLVVDALAGSMAVLLGGRVLQGVGGGLLAGLAYAVMRDALPRELWTRGSAVMSMMWGAGLLVGPVLGGVAADLGVWRWSFGLLAVAALGVAVAVPRAVGGLRADTGRDGEGGGGGSGDAAAFPVLSIALLTLAAAVVSGTGLGGQPLPTATGLAVALGVLVVFWRRERAGGARLLPSAVFRPGRPLRGVYPVMAVLCAAATVELFVPLFGQRLGGLGPLPAGLLGATFAVGWVLGELASAGADPARRPRLVAAGPVVVAIGLALVASTQGSGLLAVSVWALGLVAAGLGVGSAWPHLTVVAISAEPDEGDRAAAAVTAVQMLATAMGTSVSGVAVALGGVDPVLAGRLLHGTWAVLAAVAAAVAWWAATRLARDGAWTRTAEGTGSR